MPPTRGSNRGAYRFPFGLATSPALNFPEFGAMHDGRRCIDRPRGNGSIALAAARYCRVRFLYAALPASGRAPRRRDPVAAADPQCRTAPGRHEPACALSLEQYQGRLDRGVRHDRHPARPATGRRLYAWHGRRGEAYASELTLVGAVALAPASNPESIIKYFQAAPDQPASPFLPLELEGAAASSNAVKPQALTADAVGRNQSAVASPAGSCDMV